ncbi:MAG: hypothetical protein WD534_13420, partial [Phycisphaeraceae bacterium]
MTGFDHKCIHLTHDQPGDVRFTIEVDFMGAGQWAPYTELLAPGKSQGGYVHHTFPSGFSAHWVRVRADTACQATAQLHYT